METIDDLVGRIRDAVVKRLVETPEADDDPVAKWYRMVQGSRRVVGLPPPASVSDDDLAKLEKSDPVAAWNKRQGRNPRPIAMPAPGDALGDDIAKVDAAIATQAEPKADLAEALAEFLTAYLTGGDVKAATVKLARRLRPLGPQGAPPELAR